MAPGLTYTIPRPWRDRIADWLIGAAILMIVMLGVMFVIFQFPIPLRDTPIVFHSTTPINQESYCPGEILSFVSVIEITEPAVFSIHNAVRVADTDDILNYTIQGPFYVPRDKAATIEEEVRWTVPELPPGEYVRVTVIDADHVDSIPIFIRKPFVIREGC